MSQPWEFEEPRPQGDRFTAEEAQNRRLIVVPIEYVPQIRTARGDIVDGIRVNVVDLEGQGGPHAYMGALWFGNKLIQTFKARIGKLFVGYVTKQQVGGGFQAWVFISLTQDEATKGMAERFLQGNAEFMETCLGDVRQAEANPQIPDQPQSQRQDQWQQQDQWAPQPSYQAQSPHQRWEVQRPQPAPMAPRHNPPPPPPRPPAPPQFQQQGPAPLPPQSAADPWPAQAYQNPPPGNGNPPVQDVTPSSPGPVGQSVMDRLRAQRDQGEGPVAQSSGNAPF